MTKQQSIDQLTAMVQHVLIENKQDFVTAQTNFLASTGFLGTIISVVSQLFVSNYFWTFVLNTVVPFVIKVALFVVITLFVPYLSVIEPFLDQLIDLIDNSLLSLQQKANAKAVIDMLRQITPNDSPIVDVNVSAAEMAMLQSQNKYLENYASGTNNPLFQRSS